MPFLGSLHFNLLKLLAFIRYYLPYYEDNNTYFVHEVFLIEDLKPSEMKLKPPAGPLCSDDRSLVYDEACLIVENVLDLTGSLFKTTSFCYKCKMMFWANVEGGHNISLIVRIHSPLRFLYTIESDSGEDLSCEREYHFGQHGVYKFVMDFSCDGIDIITPPDSPYTSMYLFLLLLLLLWVAFIVFDKNNIRRIILAIIPKRLKRRQNGKMNEDGKATLNEYELTENVSEIETSSKIIYDEKSETQNVVKLTSRGINTDNTMEAETDNAEPPFSRTALPEFDVLLSLRGLIVSIHIFILVEGGTYFFFRKSTWNGFKLRDIIANTGSLYWVLAASIYLRVRNSLVRGEKKKIVFLKQVLFRSFLYMIGGILYNKINETTPSNNPSGFSLRIFGHFQRVGVSSLVIFAMEVCFMKTLIKRGPFFQDIVDCWPQLILGVVLATLHTCITYLLPVPGCPTGYTGPGGIGDYGEAELCTGGAAGYIDRSIFPRTFMMPRTFWKSKENSQTYNIKVPYDPDGLLGTLNTCFLMALAVHASRIFIYFKHPFGRSMRLGFWSFWQIFVGIMLTHFSVNEGSVPPNPYLMSLSYVLLVSGLCYFLFLCFYLLIDVWKFWSGLPFIYTGANVLVVYVGGKLLQNVFPFEWGYDKEDMEDNTLCLIKASWSVAVWTLLCYYLYQKNIICPV